MKYKIGILSIALATVVLVSMVAAAGIRAAAQSETAGTSCIIGAPAACFDSNGNMFVFVEGCDGSLLVSQNGGGAWTSLGGQITAAPAAVYQGTSSVTGLGVISVFVRGTNGLYARTTVTDGASWNPWTMLPGQVASDTGPAATATINTAGQVRQTDVFYVNSGNNHLMWDSQVNGIVTQADLGGVVTATPAAVTPATGVLDVVVRGTGGVPYERTHSAGGFGAWTKFNNGLIGAGATLVSPAAGEVFLFVTGTNGGLYMAPLPATPPANALNVDWMRINLKVGLTLSPSATHNGADIVVVVRSGDSICTLTGIPPYNPPSCNGKSWALPVDWSGSCLLLPICS